MTKQSKFLLGLGVAGLATYGYMMLRKKKGFTNYTNFAQTDYQSCLSTNPTSAPEKCCEMVGGLWYNGTCNASANTGTNTGTNTASNETITEADCVAGGGIWNGTTCTPCADPTHMVYDGQCMPDAQVKCITEQMGIWDDATQTCKCMRGVMVNGVCTDSGTGTGADTGSGAVTPPPPPPSSSTTNIFIPPYPHTYNLPIMDGSSGAGGGGGDTDKTTTDLFDWIPWILAGMTTALSVVSEQKQA